MPPLSVCSIPPLCPATFHPRAEALSARCRGSCALAQILPVSGSAWHGAADQGTGGLQHLSQDSTAPSTRLETSPASSMFSLVCAREVGSTERALGVARDLGGQDFSGGSWQHTQLLPSCSHPGQPRSRRNISSSPSSSSSPSRDLLQKGLSPLPSLHGGVPKGSSMGTWVFRFSNFQAGGAGEETSPLTSLFIHWMGALLPMGHPIKLLFPPGAGLIPCAPHGHSQGCDMGVCNRGAREPCWDQLLWAWLEVDKSPLHFLISFSLLFPSFFYFFLPNPIASSTRLGWLGVQSRARRCWLSPPRRFACLPSRRAAWQRQTLEIFGALHL